MRSSGLDFVHLSGPGSPGSLLHAALPPVFHRRDVCRLRAVARSHLDLDRKSLRPCLSEAEKRKPQPGSSQPRAADSVRRRRQLWPWVGGWLRVMPGSGTTGQGLAGSRNLHRNPAPPAGAPVTTTNTARARAGHSCPSVRRWAERPFLHKAKFCTAGLSQQGPVAWGSAPGDCASQGIHMTSWKER